VLSRNLKTTYIELVPVLHGQGDETSLTLLGRLREDPTKLETVLSRPWKPGERVRIVWEDAPATSTT